MVPRMFSQRLSRSNMGPDFIAEGFLSFPIKLLTKSKKFRAKGKAKTNESTPGVYKYIIVLDLGTGHANLL